MKNKKFIFVSLLILAIGFAAVSTTLYISGQLVFGTNKNDFDIYFSKAFLDDVDVYDDVISQDKKTITFTTNELKTIGDTSTLDYQVMNNSREYDATVTVNCNLSNSEYVSYTNTLNDTILAQTVEDGVLVVTLDKVSTEEVTETLTCSLVYNAVERTSQADLYDENTYVLSGYLQDEEGNALTNQNLVVYSETPHIVTTNSSGYFYVENLLNEKHEIYITNKTVNELESMTKEEVISSSISKGTFKVTDESVSLDNNYKLDKGKITVSDSFDKTCADLVGKVYNYDYTGGEQEFVVPCNGEYKIELWGAQGGNYSDVYQGGLGAYTSGLINLDNKASLFVFVGSQPISQKGGYNGGGSGEPLNNYGLGYGGGGATDVRLISGNWNDFDSLKSRIMVAAGGGGVSYYNNDGYLIGIKGHGGTLHGIDGYYTIINNPNSLGWGGHKDWLSTLYGFGGTQTLGGNPGKGTGTSSNYCSSYVADSYGGFGYGGSYGNCNSSSAGGGSGYYGGGSTARNGYAGGGGSSYISGHKGCDAIDESSTSSIIKHTGQSNHYSGKTFINTIMRAGNENQPTHDGNSTMTGNKGNGYARITLVSID